MRKMLTALTASAAFALAAPALAGGFSVEKSLEIGASGSALSKGGTSGGTYTKGQNGSDAYSFSENFITNTGKVSVCAGCEAFDTRTSKGWGKSVSKTNGAGSVAEAFSQRETFGKSATSFETQLSVSGNFPPGLALGLDYQAE